MVPKMTSECSLMKLTGVTTFCVGASQLDLLSLGSESHEAFSLTSYRRLIESCWPFSGRCHCQLQFFQEDGQQYAHERTQNRPCDWRSTSRPQLRGAMDSARSVLYRIVGKLDVHYGRYGGGYHSDKGTTESLFRHCLRIAVRSNSPVWTKRRDGDI